MSNVKFVYIYNGNQPRAAIAYSVVGNLNPDQIQQAGVVRVRCGIARCHPKDNFVRTVARAKAGGRLSSDKACVWADVPSPVVHAERPGSGAWWREFENDLIHAVNDQQVRAIVAEPVQAIW